MTITERQNIPLIAEVDSMGITILKPNFELTATQQISVLSDAEMLGVGDLVDIRITDTGPEE